MGGRKPEKHFTSRTRLNGKVLLTLLGNLNKTASCLCSQSCVISVRKQFFFFVLVRSILGFSIPWKYKT